MLRRTVVRELKETLDNSVFTSDDFVIELEDEHPDFLFELTFVHDSSFRYHASDGMPGIWATRSPGAMTSQEHSNVGHWDSCLADVSEWCSEIREELKASIPIYSEVEELRALIEQHISSDVSNDDEFSVAEINSLEKKFEELKARVAKLEEDQIITKKQLDEFVSGVDQVKSDVQVYPKQTWYKVATNKLVKTVISIGKSKEGRQLLHSGAKKLLGLE